MHHLHVAAYADLLTRALGTEGDACRSDDLLVAEVIRSRARLQATSGDDPVAEVLARELSYDSALIRLCRALDVETEPVRFATPAPERARLERELERCGISLATTGDPPVESGTASTSPRPAIR
jgi:hypothetical protein